MEAHIKKSVVPSKRADDGAQIFEEVTFSTNGTENGIPSFSSTPQVRRSAPDSFSQSPPKRFKAEDKPTNEVQLRNVILDWKRERLNSLANSYNEHLLEHFFLDHDGNLMDMQNWLRNPSPELINHIKKQKLEGDQSLEARFVGNDPSFNFKVKDEHSSVQQNKSSLPPKVVKKYGTLGLKHKNVVHSDVIGSSLQQDQMVEKARQEAYIIQRISTLRKEGLWGEKKLPKVQEAARPKAHWDYLLEEMVWLSADFAQERKWKKAAAKKCAKMVQKYFQDKAVQAQKAEKEQEMKLRKIASFVAKEVRTFWSNVGKLIEFKVNARLDEKKKKALDQQLSFIVDQTEKYSSMLAESMKKPDSSNVVSTHTETPTKDTSISDDEFQPEEPSDDDEATIAKEEDNPEEQASEVQLLQKESEQTLEDILNDLPADYFENRENSDMECEDENESVPESKEIASTSTTKESIKEQEIGKKETNDGDDDFEMKGESEDDEETIEKQEEEEKDINHKQELEELEAENAMSVEEIRKKYEALASSSTPFKEEEEDEEEEEDDDAKSDATMKSIDSDDEDEVLEGDEDDDEDEEDDEDNGSSEESSSVKKDVEEDEETLGIEDLIDQSFHDHEEDASASVKERNEKVDKELQDASAVAESLQPKGFTLSSTSVTTPIPFLLKHTLREYQHVGLDWLVTMFEKKLNGILADEMGLGKTIQTIALLAHLACEKKIWGPHLIVVPTSVMLNWEMEFKKWCPAFKILTYYGTQKERKLKRQGWTKSNAFHVCITSYKLVIQDHQSFRRKKWRYFILDEAQNIKNFKSQRWQLLLNFQSQRRLLLTGTPLQNSLMELWSLMHFLMPNIFASHREFREWFSNPVTGMIEGNKEYNDSIIKRLHKVLRPFILRRLKSEVEQQMPKKYEHVVMCRLSKRQRFLYEEFMSRTKTKDTLASGNFLSVINILMQLRKVCNHPNLFEARPTVSPFMMSALLYDAPSLVYGITSYDPFKHVDLFSLNLLLSELEVCLTAFAAHRIRRFQAPQKLIQEIDSLAEPPPKCPAGKIKLHVRPSSQPIPRPGISTLLGNQRAAAPSVVTLKPVTTSTTTAPTVSASNSFQTSSQWQSGVRFQLVQHGGSYKAIPLPPGSTGGMLVQQTPQGPRLIMPQRTVQPSTATTSQINTSTTSTSSGTGSVGGLQLVQTSAGQYLLTSSPIQKTTNTSASSIGLSGNTAVALLQRLQGLKGLQGSVITTGAGGRPVLRLPTSSLRPNITLPTSNTSTVAANASTVTSKPIPHNYGTNQQVTQAAKTPQNSANSSPIVSPAKIPQNKNQSNDSKEVEASSSKKKEEVSNKSIFYLSDLEEQRKHKRKEKLCFIASLNTRRCHACPIYGSDLMEAVSVLLGPIKDAALNEASFNGQGMVHCQNAPVTSIDQYWLQTECLSNLVKTPEKYLEELRDITDRFVFCVPAVVAPTPNIRVSHPHPSILWESTCKEFILKQELAKPLSPLHPIVNASVTQFPDPRLIQYDCGKLQTLDKLLRQLKNGSHRVLIFTQMTKMLDVFEVFLNFHGHLYLRLDGTTKVDQRQTLMERFNQDKRIFAFILSTRSGGIGINLTGADTVIFYDSDWNPTMDAQAQDRCHRIGQTRDVHIYRLISEKTIEENILKKANQKRLLGDLAIEGGNFTTASLKKQTIQDLFEVDINEQDPSKRMSEVLERNRTIEENEKENVKMGYLENALAAAEDETDVQAAKTAKAEADAELAEFDENIPLDEQDGEEISKAEQEVALLMKQLTPIEKYAMHFLEESDEGILAEAERLAAEIEQQKKEWEMGRLQALQDEEKRFNIEEEDDEDMLTYSSVDAHNQVKNQGGKKEGRCRGRPRGRSVKSLKKVRKIVSSNLSSDENSCDSENYNDDSSVENKDSYSEASDEEDSIAKRVKASEYSTLSLGRGSKGDKESPRTRSRGPLKINLWTLDETPLPLSGRTKLPGNSRSPIPDTVVDFHLENDNNETLMVNGDVNGHKDNSGRNEELLCLDGRDDGEDGMLVCKSTNDVPSILTSLSLPNGGEL